MTQYRSEMDALRTVFYGVCSECKETQREHNRMVEGEANHHCTGEACPVCANIHQAEQTLRNLSTGTIVHAAVNPILIMCGAIGVVTTDSRNMMGKRDCR